MVQIWQVEPEAHDWTPQLYWTSSQRELNLSNLPIQGARGLSQVNARLIEQRDEESFSEISVEEDDFVEVPV
ncbi:MAG: hypothetical protein ON057_000428 [Glomeribacter sp. 1016415]|nr:hypothetical protein [Glomeribacter sp. 1016415]